MIVMMQPLSDTVLPRPKVNIIRKKMTAKNCGQSNHVKTELRTTTRSKHYVRKQREFADGFWVRDESQSLAALRGHSRHVLVGFVRQIAQDGKNSDAGQ